MQENYYEYLQKLGNHVRSLRKRKNLTLCQLCYKHGLEPSTVSRIEKAQVEAKYVTLIKLANALGLTIAEFLEF